MSFRISQHKFCPIEGEDSEDALPDVPEDDENLKEGDSDGKEGWLRSIFSLLTTSPYDLHLILNEYFEIIDWDLKAISVARPLGNILTFVFYVLRLLQDNLIKPNYHKISKSTDAFDITKSSTLRAHHELLQYQRSTAAKSAYPSDWYFKMLGRLDKIFKVSILALFCLSIFIMYRFLFSRYKVYSMFYLRARPKSKNVTKRSLEDLGYKYMEDLSRSSIWGMMKFTLFGRKKNANQQPHGEYYYQLKKWNPSKFVTVLYCSFSPTCLTFLLVTETSFTTILGIIVHQFLFYFILCDRCINRIEDEQCLASANIAEINAKIIKPRASALTQDAMVDATPFGNEYVQFFPSYTTTRSHIFQTHTLTGDVVTEQYNSTRNAFEDFSSSSKAENYIRPSRENHYGYTNTPRSKFMNGASVRPMFLSRQVSPNRVSTPTKALSYVASSSSAPSTPVLRPTQAAYADHSLVGNTSGIRANSSFRDNTRTQRANTYSRLRRNSVSPLKTNNVLAPISSIRSSQRQPLGGDSTMSFSMELPDEEIPFEEVARRGRRVNGNLCVQNNGTPVARGSVVSSRNSSLSPSKNHLSYRRDSTDSRPPFR